MRASSKNRAMDLIMKLIPFGSHLAEKTGSPVKPRLDPGRSRDYAYA